MNIIKYNYIYLYNLRIYCARIIENNNMVLMNLNSHYFCGYLRVLLIIN